MMSKYVYAVATLSGTIIGVGFFALPYITLKVGIWLMLTYFLILGSLVIFIHYLFGRVALETPDFLRLAGYAKIYLGKRGWRIALISETFGSFGAILAYLIVGGEFFTNLLFPIFGGSVFFYTFLYFLFGALIIFFGIKVISKIEFWSLILFFGVLIFIFWQGLSFFKLENLFIKTGDLTDFFLPYGPILFSLWGASLIPEIEEMLGKGKEMIRKIIPISVLIPALVYLLFVILITGISGSKTSPEAISGLREFLGQGIINLGFFAGILTTFTSFIAIGLTLKKVFWYDLKLPKNFAWICACFPPFFLFLVGLNDFIEVISFVGAIMLAINGILILLMYQRIKKPKFAFLTYPLILIFAIGIIYEIVYLLK